MVEVDMQTYKLGWCLFTVYQNSGAASFTGSPLLQGGEEKNHKQFHWMDNVVGT